MKTLARRLWLEPALFLGVLNAAVQAVQLAALDLSPGVSLAIVVIGTSLQALGTRVSVTPTAKLNDQADVVADAIPGAGA